MTDRKVGDNQEILFLLKERLQIGLERYGHGINVMDDTRSWGTSQDSWTEMGLEEALDLALYLGAAILRVRHLEEDLVRQREMLNELEKPPYSSYNPPVQKGGFSRFKAWLGRLFS